MGDDELVNVNPTDAKDIALYFVSRTGIKATPSTFGKTTNQAKSLLESGYTVNEVNKVIDYLIDVEKVELFSLGYVNSSITSVYKKAMKESNALIAKAVVAEQNKIVNREELKVGESSERNRQKTGTIGTKSRFGEKFNFDMFTES